jgi:hypothetical protein
VRCGCGKWAGRVKSEKEMSFDVTGQVMARSEGGSAPRNYVQESQVIFLFNFSRHWHGGNCEQKPKCVFVKI